MLKRFLTAVILILIIGGIVIFAAWFISRRTATKNGTAPVSFREFITLSPKKAPQLTDDDGLSSEFTPEPDGTAGENSNNDEPGTLGGGNDGGAADNLTVSQFTNTTLSPTGQLDTTGVDPFTNNTGSNPNGGSGTGSFSGTGTGSGSSGGGSGSGGNTGGGISGGGTGTTGTPQVLCSDEDTNITFTQAELDRLAQLQTRFYTLAPNLYTDGDVNSEFAAYDSFKVEEAQIQELTMQCKAKAPLLAAQYRKRIPTPFWYEQNVDDQTYTDPYGTNYTNQTSKSVLERILRISFW